MFDRTIVLTLQRRRDRLTKFAQQLFNQKLTERTDNWEPPIPTPAIDGKRCPPPAWWEREPGAWGCYQSHLRAIERALNDDVGSLLVFEDDAVLCDDFLTKLITFLAAVPDDWNMIYLGGSHRATNLGRHNWPRKINGQVYRCKMVNATFAYAISYDAMRKLYQERLFQSHDRNPHLHIDQLYALAMAPEDLDLKVYAPTEWLVGHDAGVSDITGLTHDGVAWWQFRPPTAG